MDLIYDIPMLQLSYLDILFYCLLLMNFNLKQAYSIKSKYFSSQNLFSLVKISTYNFYFLCFNYALLHMSSMYHFQLITNSNPYSMLHDSLCSNQYLHQNFTGSLY